jgi:hypothetical protein
MIGVLLYALFPSPACMAFAGGKSGTAVSGSKDSPEDSEGDAGCCSFCFCCHFTGVLKAGDPRPSLQANGFLTTNLNPLPLQLPNSPLDQPPRG